MYVAIWPVPKKRENVVSTTIFAVIATKYAADAMPISDQLFLKKMIGIEPTIIAVTGSRKSVEFISSPYHPGYAGHFNQISSRL
ncbi:MAG: hypothetical protein M1422_06735 [Candidatus Thermoplasmatota archaeon]|nr:hypothetical protein [Candidatus Sysuiplasma jiujiangense]MBX8641093.1 hypothetical protein [Candidatus Sysuiplasma jiujiangense]MCL4317947.1 hypothetical protein [Candidatus Thermoplasmatota archaeon]MCL5253201.1 hypothetical protein [Candidatus Thermoplasmatota archaeon]